jgi:hypothetical protein
MELYPEVQALDFVRLMADFLTKCIDAHQYRRSYFDLMKERAVHMQQTTKADKNV